METNKIYDATEYNDIKELIYASVEKFRTNVAFIIKHKQDRRVEYEKITYEKLLEDINNFGTALYLHGLKGKRIAIIGKNRYEWELAHLSNMLRRNGFCSIR